MANNPIKWSTAVVSLASYLSAALNSLGSNVIDASGAAIDNTSNLATHMDLELTIASLDLSGQSSPSVDIYLLESVDGGTDYDNVTDAVDADAAMPPADKICTKLGLRPFTEAEVKTAVKSMIPIPPGHFKLCLRNKTGVALPASGNVLSYRTYNLNLVSA